MTSRSCRYCAIWLMSLRRRRRSRPASCRRYRIQSRFHRTGVVLLSDFYQGDDPELALLAKQELHRLATHDDSLSIRELAEKTLVADLDSTGGNSAEVPIPVLNVQASEESPKSPAGVAPCSENDREELERLYTGAKRAIGHQDWQDAVQLLEAASAIDAGYRDVSIRLEFAREQLQNSLAVLNASLTVGPRQLEPDSRAYWTINVRNAGPVPISDIVATRCRGRATSSRSHSTSDRTKPKP